MRADRIDIWLFSRVSLVRKLDRGKAIRQHPKPYQDQTNVNETTQLY
jgi:hypothetical protein